MRTSRWYMLVKLASDHGDTMHGQMKAYETEAVIKSISKLKAKVMANDMEDILPRWRGEARRMILSLPSTERIGNMSMYELERLSSSIEGIYDYMRRYSSKRLTEILGG